MPCRTITILSETGPRVTELSSSPSLFEEEGALRDWVLLSRSADPADPEEDVASLFLCLRLPPRLLLPGRRCL